jgi:protein tyrosine kinase modulator
MLLAMSTPRSAGHNAPTSLTLSHWSGTVWPSPPAGSRMAIHPRQVPDDTEASQDAPLWSTRRDRSGDVDLVDVDWYVRAILRRWPLILIGLLLGGVLGFWYAARQPLTYEGVTTLLVVPPAQSSGAQINPATFRAIVENGTLAAQVIDELKLQGITAQGFVERALAVEEVRGTSVVKVKVFLPDPKLAADASRRLAQKAIALTQQITQQEGASIQEQLKNHLNDAQARLRTAEKELLTYKQSAQVDLIKGDTDAQLKERGGLISLMVEIEAERARLAAAETEIKRQQPLLSAPRTPGAEDALRRTQAASRGGAKGEVNSEHLDLTNAYVNPVYQTLDFQIATSRTRIAALEKQRDELINGRKLGGKELAELSELYRRQIEQARLQANFDLATRVYSDLAVKYEQSRTQPFGNIAQLQVVDAALPPDRPVSRRRLQYGVFGASVGLVGFVMLALLVEIRVRRTQRRPV